MPELKLNAVQAAIAHVMECPADMLVESTSLKDFGIDSIALIVVADVIEDSHPGWKIDNDQLNVARCVGDIINSISVGDMK